MKLGLWPEVIELADHELADALPGTVQASEFRGLERVVQVELGGQTFRKTVATSFDATFGRPCWMRFPAARMFVFDGVFMRHPALRIVSVEADGGWIPHYMYRMDHAYQRHRHWMRGQELERLPSEYFREHIYFTFQDDYTAFQFKDHLNIERMMWANDYPHSDSTWPWSQELLARHLGHMSEWEKDRILHDNVAELYRLDTSGLAAAA